MGDLSSNAPDGRSARSPRGRVRMRFVALGVGVASLACAIQAPYQPLDTMEELRTEQAQRLGSERASQVTIPFEVDSAVIQAADGRISIAASERVRTQQIQDFIFSWLDLKYSLMPTRSAVEAFHAREANCLSFVNLFVGLGRQHRLNPFYVEVEDYKRWSYQEGTVVSHGHIVAGMYVDGDLTTFDFLPYRAKSYRDFEPIGDIKATAHYYNNLGAEALISGELERARDLLRVAVDLSPDFTKALNNLGVSLLRLGNVDEAVALYRRGLEVNATDVALLTNLARGFQALGDEEEAFALLDRVEELDDANPFIFVYRGELALADQDYPKALTYMRKALRLDSEIPEVHLGLAKVFFSLGELDRARHHVERTLKLDATHAEARKYAALLHGATNPVENTG